MSEYNLPEELRYSKEDEWVRAESDERYVIGVSDFAQQQLGDVVFVELPEAGADITAGEPFGVIESVKAVSDLYAPVTGKVLEVNAVLEDAPETVNADCYGEAWMIVVQPADPAQYASLLDAAGYRENIAGRET